VVLPQSHFGQENVRRKEVQEVSSGSSSSLLMVREAVLIVEVVEVNLVCELTLRPLLVSFTEIRVKLKPYI
jgi:hypothetical protein